MCANRVATESLQSKVVDETTVRRVLTASDILSCDPSSIPLRVNEQVALQVTESQIAIHVTIVTDFHSK